MNNAGSVCTWPVYRFLHPELATQQTYPSRVLMSQQPRTISMGLQHESKPIAMSDPICDWKKGAIPPKWNGQAAEGIVEHLEGFCHYLKESPMDGGHQRLVLYDDLR